MYDKLILNNLLDKYERRGLNKENNKPVRRIFFHFNKKNLPDYFVDTTSKYKREINAIAQHLAQKGFIKIHWVKFEEGNLIDKVSLNTDAVDEIYKHLGRKPKWEKVEKIKKLIADYKRSYPSWVTSFYNHLYESLDKGKSVNSYIDIDYPNDVEKLFLIINSISEVKEEIPKRVFSIKVLGNSKEFERFSGRVLKIIREFNTSMELEDDRELLAEYGIVDNPQHIFLSGDVTFKVRGKGISIREFYPDVGISTETVKDLEIMELNARYVITVENLTSYYQLIKTQSPGFIAVYLGGYHNMPRRQLLMKIHGFCRQNKIDIPFYHWGDIDYGGFTIFEHLRRGCEIDFKPVLMDVETLLKHKDYALPINKNYRSKLKNLLNKDEFGRFHSVITEMLKENIRLEQESVSPDLLSNL
ncbi:MAG: hypothetical protein PWQ82_1244 [Thermosediminibacterales bacterium]|nr:hypothetical protein [Thermosediminibacterales bacterium]MDK2836774.1 hypothetical protein [Thermosediminibacterales bacterium]